MMKTLLPLLFLATGVFLTAQDKLPPEQRLNGKEVLEKFKSAKAVIDASVVEIHNGAGDLLAFGTVIAPDQVLTKASVLIEQRGITFKLPDGKKIVPKRVDRRANNDLALFTVPDGKLKPVKFVPAKDLKQGMWLATPSIKEAGIMVGVKAANERSIRKQKGVIGVILGEDGQEIGGVKIKDVARKGGAAAAGLQKGDVITSIEGKEVIKRDDLTTELAKHEPGKLLKVKVKRDDEEIEAEVLLGHQEHVYAQFNSIARISGPTSKRKSGFDDIIQHDIPLSVTELGGPMLNIKGECVGINISRINRAENFALPSEIVEMFIANEEPEPEPPQVAGGDDGKPPAPAPDEPKKSDPPPSKVVPKVIPVVPAEILPVKDPMPDIEGKKVEPYKLYQQKKPVRGKAS